MGYFIHEDQPAGLPLANLDELNDTNITTPADGDVLEYDSASGKWINRNMTWQDVTPTFDLTGSSVASVTVASARANGSQIQVSLAITNNGSKKSGLGNDFNCGKINAPYKPTTISREFGFSYQTTLCITVDTNGNISARLLNGEWLANYVLSVTLTFPYV